MGAHVNLPPAKICWGGGGGGGEGGGLECPFKEIRDAEIHHELEDDMEAIFKKRQGRSGGSKPLRSTIYIYREKLVLALVKRQNLQCDTLKC